METATVCSPLSANNLKYPSAEDCEYVVEDGARSLECKDARETKDELRLVVSGLNVFDGLRLRSSLEAFVPNVCVWPTLSGWTTSMSLNLVVSVVVPCERPIIRNHPRLALDHAAAPTRVKRVLPGTGMGSPLSLQGGAKGQSRSSYRLSLSEEDDLNVISSEDWTSAIAISVNCRSSRIIRTS